MELRKWRGGMSQLLKGVVKGSRRGESGERGERVRMKRGMI